MAWSVLQKDLCAYRDTKYWPFALPCNLVAQGAPLREQYWEQLQSACQWGEQPLASPSALHINWGLKMVRKNKEVMARILDTPRELFQNFVYAK
jgi:hypothetical protein